MLSMDDRRSLDLELYRQRGLASAPSLAIHTKATGCGGKWFVAGPIPGPWIGAAATLPGRSLHVAMAIWYLRKLTKTDTVVLARHAREKFGIKRDACSRGLRHLEEAGLVSVLRHQGRLPRVTILTNVA